MKKRLHELTLVELEKHMRLMRVFLMFSSMVFAVFWLVTFLFGYVVDPLVGMLCLTTYWGFVILTWTIAYTQYYFVWFLRMNKW